MIFFSFTGHVYEQAIIENNLEVVVMTLGFPLVFAYILETHFSICINNIKFICIDKLNTCSPLCLNICLALLLLMFLE